VIFGGTGDLARRKILPGLFRRFLAGQMVPDSRVIGAARAPLDAASYREMIRKGIEEFGGEEARDGASLSAFLDRLDYVSVDATVEEGWPRLASLMREGVVRAFYFSVAPGLFGTLAERLFQHGIAGEDAASWWKSPSAATSPRRAISTPRSPPLP
jgi:glucose-6-phosphate 1-dehydrogenase